MQRTPPKLVVSPSWEPGHRDCPSATALATMSVRQRSICLVLAALDNVVPQGGFKSRKPLPISLERTGVYLENVD